jgi:predicted nuclease of restriction endonuclease-like (RecB) superfamily
MPGNPGGYPAFLDWTKDQIRSARHKALKAAEEEMILLFWDIGRIIAEKQKPGPKGISTLKQLQVDLQNEFGGTLCFSSSNLHRMKSFYETYRDDNKLQQMVREISWAHNIIILERCADNSEREFYLRETTNKKWSTDQLIRQIELRACGKARAGRTMSEHARALRELDKIAQKSKMTEKDAKAIGKNVKKSIQDHYQDN